MTAMNPFDLAVLIIVVLSIFLGGMRGIISQIGTLAAWIVSLIVSARYYGVFVPMVPVDEQWKTPCAAFVAFVVSFVAISVATRFLKKAISLAGFKEFDRQIGALLGLLKGVVLCMAITFFCVLATDKTREIVDSSKSGAFFIGVISNVQDAFPDSELKTKFAEVAASLKHTDDHKAVSEEIESLKKYLTTRVFTQTAAEVVKEADEEEEAREKGTTTETKRESLFQRFVDDARNLNRKVASQIVRTTPGATSDNASTAASDESDSYAASSRRNDDDSNASASSANSTEKETNEGSGLQNFWNSLGVSAPLPLATSTPPTQQTQTQAALASSSGATFDDSAQGTEAKNNAESTPEVGYGAYRTRSTSSSRLKSYRYSVIGSSNY